LLKRVFNFLIFVYKNLFFFINSKGEFAHFFMYQFGT
jgi:hypothetical protein